MNRREVLAGGLGLGFISTVTAQSPGRKPSLRAGHITDVHILPEREAPQGVQSLFEHLLPAQGWSAELILNTGDTVMAVDGKVSAAKAAVQIDLWKEATKASKVPIRSCLGNHDVWDGVEPNERIPRQKKGFTLMTEVLGLPAPYYSFDQGNWHFIALNSVANWPTYGELSREQFEWLKKDLKQTPRERPICVLSHLPIVSVTSSLYGNGQCRGDGVLVPKVWQHIDCWEISELFRRHPNVKLCLSGHMHTQDRCEYRGVWYICGGAVSGAWWNGSEYGFPPCYGAIDFYPDGAFDYRFVDYGWKARQWQGQQLGD